jgi:hypothetical protein
MTQAVTFEFVSPQFVFESGNVTFFKGARLRDDGEISTAKFADGSIAGVLVEGPLECDFMLDDLKVIRRSDGRRYGVAGLSVTRQLARDQLAAGRVLVTLDLALLLVIRVENSSGEPIPGALINIAQPSEQATWEMPVSERGEVVIFGKPGSHFVTVGRIGERWLEINERVTAFFEVEPGEHGERVITLRVP